MNESAKVPRCGSMSVDQKKEIIEYMKKHPELKIGKFTQEFTAKKSQALWESLATNLNSLPGAKKDWKKWRKTWHDMKSATKAKNSILKRHQEGTGGGPPSVIKITDEDNEILEIIGKVAAEGDPGIKESQTEFFESCSTFNIYPDHEYITSVGNDIIIEPCEAVVSAPTISAEKKVEPLEPKKTESKGGRLKSIRRLENSIRAIEQLAKHTETKIALKEKYYNNKINILKDNLEVKKRIALALEAIADNFKEN